MILRIFPELISQALDLQETLVILVERFDSTQVVWGSSDPKPRREDFGVLLQEVDAVLYVCRNFRINSVHTESNLCAITLLERGMDLLKQARTAT